MMKFAFVAMHYAAGIRPANNNHDVQSLLKEGDELARGSQWSQALEKYDLLLERDQSSQLAMSALFNGAIAKHNLNRFEQAIDNYGRVIDGTESLFLRARSHENRAAAHCKLAREQDVASAFEDLTTALSLFNENLSGQTVSMEEMFRAAIQRIPRIRGTFHTQ